MAKNFVCIFAHPDDEAFGPAGTIHKLTRDYDVYILCATKGQAGLDSDDIHDEKLYARRAQEICNSAEILGVKKVHFLGFQDGTLSNDKYHKLADKIQEYLEELQPEGIMTFETRGVSGHIDHITVSLATTFVFQKLSFIKKLWYWGVLKQESDKWEDYFVYFPEGFEKKQFDKVVDVSDVWETKVKAMKCHKSQKHDAKEIMKRRKDLPREEYFLIKEK